MSLNKRLSLEYFSSVDSHNSPSDPYHDPSSCHMHAYGDKKKLGVAGRQATGQDFSIPVPA